MRLHLEKTWTEVKTNTYQAVFRMTDIPAPDDKEEAHLNKSLPLSPADPFDSDRLSERSLEYKKRNGSRFENPRSYGISYTRLLLVAVSLRIAGPPGCQIKSLLPKLVAQVPDKFKAKALVDTYPTPRQWYSMINDARSRRTSMASYQGEQFVELQFWTHGLRAFPSYDVKVEVVLPEGVQLDDCVISARSQMALSGGKWVKEKSQNFYLSGGSAGVALTAG